MSSRHVKILYQGNTAANNEENIEQGTSGVRQTLA